MHRSAKLPQVFHMRLPILLAYEGYKRYIMFLGERAQDIIGPNFRACVEGIGKHLGQKENRTHKLGAPKMEHDGYGFHQNLQIKHNALVFYIVQIVFQLFPYIRQRTGVAVLDLRPAR